MLPTMMRAFVSASCLALLMLAASAPATAAQAPAGPLRASRTAVEPSLRAKAVRVAQGPKKPKQAPDKQVAPAAPERASTDPRTPDSAVRGVSRIEFDDRLIRGQTNKANALYLFERRESSLRSLLKKRTDFHQEIDQALE